MPSFLACFSRTAPKPLKIGLGEELIALAGVHPALADLSRTPLRRALKVYTGAPACRKAVARGGPRYDLAGQLAGAVTPEQPADARSPRVRQPPAPASKAPEPSASPATGNLPMTPKQRICKKRPGPPARERPPSSDWWRPGGGAETF